MTVTQIAEHLILPTMGFALIWTAGIAMFCALNLSEAFGFLSGKRRRKPADPVPETEEKRSGPSPEEPQPERVPAPQEEPRQADEIPETCGPEVQATEVSYGEIPPTVVPDQDQRTLFYVEEEITFLHSDEIIV